MEGKELQNGVTKPHKVIHIIFVIITKCVSLQCGIIIIIIGHILSHKE